MKQRSETWRRDVEEGRGRGIAATIGELELGGSRAKVARDRGVGGADSNNAFDADVFA